MRGRRWCSVAEQALPVTEAEHKAAKKQWPDIEDAFRQNLGMNMEWDEAIDGCTVYEPDGFCPHGHRGLAQIRTWQV